MVLFLGFANSGDAFCNMYYLWPDIEGLRLKGRMFGSHFLEAKQLPVEILGGLENP